MDFEYTGAVQTATLAKGKYTIECWGAQGGGTNGGKGGYSIGTLLLTAETTAYIYVGGQGATGSSLNAGGFNGGGAGGYQSTSGSGGGASDVRLGTDSLYARLIVAGGGGGMCGYSSYAGGIGGGTSGGAGTGYATTSCGYGGTQTAGGATATYATSGTAGSFGKGGAGSTASSSYNYAAGGGGGWYGGGGSGYYSSSRRYNRGCGGAGGGSGYVYTSDTASNYPSGCLLNSTYYLTEASTVDGSTSITSPTGATETGHAGNGYVRLTYVPTEPDAPTYADVTFADYFSASFEWDAAENATGYKYTFNGTTYSTTSTSATVNGLVAGTTYTIKLCSYNEYGSSDWIEFKIQAPSANFKQTMWDYQSLSLKWDAAKYATKYILKRNGTQIASQTGTTFTDSGLSPSTSYTYQLYAATDYVTSLAGTLTGKTEDGRIVQQVEFNSVSLTPNPTTINTSLDLKVTCEDKTVLYTGEKFFSNEIYSGEV